MAIGRDILEYALPNTAQDFASAGINIVREGTVQTVEKYIPNSMRILNVVFNTAMSIHDVGKAAGAKCIGGAYVV
jgi:hypothetical protein